MSSEVWHKCMSEFQWPRQQTNSSICIFDSVRYKEAINVTTVPKHQMRFTVKFQFKCALAVIM